MQPVLTSTKNDRFYEIREVSESPSKDLSHFIGLPPALQIICHQQMLQNRLFILAIFQKKNPMHYHNQNQFI